MIFDSIKHIHAHDNFGDEDAHLAFGEGSIDLKYIINKLEEKSYDGIYIIEVNDTDSIKKSYEYMKKNKKYQEENNLDIDGKVGPATRKSLNTKIKESNNSKYLIITKKYYTKENTTI